VGHEVTQQDFTLCKQNCGLRQGVLQENLSAPATGGNEVVILIHHDKGHDEACLFDVKRGDNSTFGTQGMAVGGILNIATANDAAAASQSRCADRKV
jgi:hypothetical protein